MTGGDSCNTVLRMGADRKIVIRLLGGFEVMVDGEPISSGRWSRRKAAELVKLVALSPGFAVDRELAMETLWPDLAPVRAGANLRKAAFHARRAMGSADILVLDGAVVGVGPEWTMHTDAAEFERLASAGLGSDDEEECRRAAAAYGGDLLPHDRYADWLALHRDRLRHLHLRVLAGGKLWGRLVEEDPTNETAHQAILRGHLHSGDRVAALRSYESLRTALRNHLGILPNETTMALYEEALSLDAPDRPTPRERARALLAWGVVHWERKDVAEAERTAAEARALAVDAGLGRELADASELLGLIAYAQGRWSELMSEQMAETLAETPEMTSFLLDAHMCMSEFALFEQDGTRVVDGLAAAILDAADEAGSRQGEAVGLLLRGESILLSNEDPLLAAPDLERARRLHGESDSLTGAALAAERLAQLEAVRGHQDMAVRRHREALALAERAPTRRHLVPFVYGGLLDGLDVDQALGVVAEAEEAITGMDICPPCAMSFRLGAARTYARLGRHTEAEDYLSQAEAVAEMWTAGPWHAAIKETQAEWLLHRGGDRADARRLLEEAASGFADSSRPREEARCRALLATLTEEGTPGERPES